MSYTESKDRGYVDAVVFLDLKQRGRGGGGNSIVFRLSFLSHSARQYDVI